MAPDAITQFIVTFSNSWMFLPTIIIITALGSILAFKYIFDPSEDNIERYALKEVVRGHTEEIVELFGSDVKKKVSYGISPVGRVEKAFGYKEYQALQEEKDIEEEEDEEYIETEDGDTLELGNNFYYLKIRPDSFLKNILADLTDDILNLDIHTDYIIVEKDYVKDGEVLTIDDNWNPTKIAGVWVPDNIAGAEFVKGQTFKSMFEETLETAKEAVRSTNHMNLKFAQNIQELEKQEELLQKRFGSKTAGMVNEN